MRPIRLRWEIAAALCVKLAALTAIYLLFFGAQHRLALDGESVASHIAGANPPPVLIGGTESWTR